MINIIRLQSQELKERICDIITDRIDDIPPNTASFPPGMRS